MPPLPQAVDSLGIVVVAGPALVLVLLGLTALFGRPFSERTMVRLVEAATVVGLLAALAILAIMLVSGDRSESITLGEWVHLGDDAATHPVAKPHVPAHPSAEEGAAPHYQFLIRFVFDRLSVPFVILSFVLCGTIGAFASRYMHREPGFTRFFFLFALFVVGMIVTSLAGTIETLFAGWEMVGLSSALLVAFYHERPSPVRNGLRVWAIYRVSDAALLIAAVVLHRMRGHGDFSQFLGELPWPEGKTALTEGQALAVGVLLLIAAAGKSALVPFSGWLPRAMEGPTPSSAVFYGALSVHLGAFLLLRLQPLLEASATLRVMVVALGLTTALFAAFAQRVQTDIKCALSFASLTQVGIITTEIGFGFSYLALIHILGHACLRTLQFVRAPTLLADYRVLENAIGERLPRTTPFGGVSEGLRDRLYRLALERGYLDALLADYVVRPFLSVFRAFDAAERRWTNYLNGADGGAVAEQETRQTVIEDAI